MNERGRDAVTSVAPVRLCTAADAQLFYFALYGFTQSVSPCECVSSSKRTNLVGFSLFLSLSLSPLSFVFAHTVEERWTSSRTRRRRRSKGVWTRWGAVAAVARLLSTSGPLLAFSSSSSSSSFSPSLAEAHARTHTQSSDLSIKFPSVLSASPSVRVRGQAF